MSSFSFTIRQLKSCSNESIQLFLRSIWGEFQSKAISQRWWFRGDHNNIFFAYDENESKIAGMVVFLESYWPVNNARPMRVASICGWYTSPDYFGKGVGKFLARSIEERFEGVNALAISASAEASFKKLGWYGPYPTSLLLLPFPGLRKKLWGAGRFRLRIFKGVTAGFLPGELINYFNFLEEARPSNCYRRRRNADDWIARLQSEPSRRYTFGIVESDQKPVACYAIRSTDNRSGNIYRLSNMFIVSDLIVNTHDAETLDFIAACMVTGLPFNAGSLLVCSTDSAVISTFSRKGWMSERSRVVGRQLASKAPEFMLGGALAKLSPSDIVMTFCDSDLDFNI